MNLVNRKQFSLENSYNSTTKSGCNVINDVYNGIVRKTYLYSEKGQYDKYLWFCECRSRARNHPNNLCKSFSLSSKNEVATENKKEI
jgi:hypothetical protein